MREERGEKQLFLNVKQFQFLNSRMGVLETVLKQNHKTLKQALTGCDTGVIVPRRGKLISLPRSSLGYVSPAAC